MRVTQQHGNREIGVIWRRLGLEVREEDVGQGKTD